MGLALIIMKTAVLALCIKQIQICDALNNFLLMCQYAHDVHNHWHTCLCVLEIVWMYRRMAHWLHALARTLYSVCRYMCTTKQLASLEAVKLFFVLLGTLLDVVMWLYWQPCWYTCILTLACCIVWQLNVCAGLFMSCCGCVYAWPATLLVV